MLVSACPVLKVSNNELSSANKESVKSCHLRDKGKNPDV